MITKNVFFVLTWIVFSSYAAAEEGLMSYYGFDEGQGELIQDGSGNGNTGKMLGGVTWYNEGKIGKCLLFDGQTGYVWINTGFYKTADKTVKVLDVKELLKRSERSGVLDVEGLPKRSESLLSIKETLTIEAWTKGYGMILCGGRWGNYGDQGQYFVKITRSQKGKIEGNVMFGLYVDHDEKNRSERYYCSGTNSFSLNKWTHVVAVYDGNYMKIYIDGKCNAQKEIGRHIVDPATKVNIGTTDVAGTLKSIFLGFIDEVRCYNRALSSDEIKAHYLYATSQPAAETGNDMTKF